ncbi:MAG: DUF1559 domain-containing protein [Planctomycetales bacterium]|nr:DUF1559 domain-containing protein [Planctomycetales bacterium]
MDDSYIGKIGPCVGCGKDIQVGAPSMGEVQLAEVDVRRITIENAIKRNVKRALIRTFVISVSAMLVVSLFAYLLAPSLQTIRAMHDKNLCLQNLQRIARALDQYANDHDAYPPPMTVDSSGRPLHSWRTLLLPYLGEEELYSGVQWDLPWNSTENSFLANSCPDVYRSPSGGGPTIGETSYVLITGTGTIFPKSGPLKRDQISDGLRNTLLVVETAMPVLWHEPLDITFPNLNPNLCAKGKNSIGGTYSDGATAVLANGTPVWLPIDISATVLRAMVTPDQGEEVNLVGFTQE